MIRGAPGGEKRIVRDARRQAAGKTRLVLRCDLDGLNVLHQVIDTNVAAVNVLFDLMEDGAPHGHLAGAVRGDYVVAGDNPADAVRREFAAVRLRQDSEIGNRGFQGGRGRTVAFGILAVAGSAIGAKEIEAFDRADELLKLLIRLRLRLGLRARLRHSEKCESEDKDYRCRGAKWMARDLHVSGLSLSMCQNLR